MLHSSIQIWRKLKAFKKSYWVRNISQQNFNGTFHSNPLIQTCPKSQTKVDISQSDCIDRFLLKKLGVVLYLKPFCYWSSLSPYFRLICKYDLINFLNYTIQFNYLCTKDSLLSHCINWTNNTIQWQDTIICMLTSWNIEYVPIEGSINLLFTW